MTWNSMKNEMLQNPQIKSEYNDEVVRAVLSARKENHFTQQKS